MRAYLLFFVFLSISLHSQDSIKKGQGLKYADSEKLSDVPYILPPKVTKGGGKENNSIDLSKDFPPIRSQGAVGSCASWACVYGVRSYLQKKKENYSYKIDETLDESKVFSPMFVYNIVKLDNQSCDSAGSYIKDNLDFMKDFGACKKISYDPLPYDYSSCTDYPFRSKKHMDEAKNYKINNYGWFIRHDTYYSSGAKLSKIKDFLAKGYPVIIGVDIDRSFLLEGGTKVDTCKIWDKFDGHNSGAHAMVCVGYNNTLKAIKVFNSWDKTWANKGYGWISYSMIDDFLSEAYVVDPIGFSSISTKAIAYVPKESQSKYYDQTNSLWKGKDLDVFFKKNRYQPYNDIRIMPVEINKKEESAIFKVYQLVGKEIIEVDVFEIKKDESYEFAVNNIAYQFEFKDIKPYRLFSPNAVFYNLTWDKQ